MIFYCCDYYSVLIAVKVAKIENKSKHPPPQNADAVTFTPEPAYGHRTHNVYMMTHTVAYFFFGGRIYPNHLSGSWHKIMHPPPQG